MEISEITAFGKKIIIIALFVIFLFLRLFVSYSHSSLGADNLKYLELSKNFPHHTLHALTDKELYLDHGPFYPYVIHFFTFIFQEDFIAAVFINLLSAIITFFIIYNLFMLLSKNFYIAFLALLFFTLSVELILISHEALKESFTVMLIISSIYFYVKSVKFYDNRSIVFASLFGAFLALTVDHVIFLFPTFILSYIFFNKGRINLKKLIFPNLKYAAIPFLITLMTYGSWLSIKAYQYSINEYYPAGLEGAPVMTKNFGIFHLLTPNYFDDYDPNIPTGFTTRIRNYVYGIGYMFNTIPFDIPRGLNFTSMRYLLLPKHVFYIIVLYLPIAIITAFGLLHIIRNFIKTKKIYNNANLYLTLVFLVFIFPLTQKHFSPRYILTDYIFLYYFIGLGFFIFFKKISKLKIYKYMISIIIVLLLILVPFWYYHNNNFVLFTTSDASAYKTAEFIEKNIKKDDVVMAQAGYTVKLIYQTNNKIIGLPPLSKNLFKLIDYYNAKYIIFGTFYTVDNYQYAINSIKFIQEHPEKFKLVATISEDYGDSTRSIKDEVFIYEVIK